MLLMLIVISTAFSPFGMSDLVAGDPAKKKPTASQLIVRDVSVFLVSAHGKKLNDAKLFRSTTPGYMLSRRLSADAENSHKPVPLGLMTFEGPAVKDIDILIEFPSGRFLSHWPTARIQSKRIYWRAQNMLKESQLSMKMQNSHWLSHLQSADRLFLKGINKSERFILYDVELNHVPGITLTHSKEGFQIQNRQAYPLQHVTILQPTSQKQEWKLAAINQVPGFKKKEKEKKPAPQTETTTKSKANDPLSDKSLKDKAKVKKAGELAALGGQLRAIGALPKLTKPTTKSTAKPTPAAVKVPPISIPFADRPPLTQEKIMGVWEKTLTELGLGKPETTHVLKILAQHALRNDQATVVYCMDESYLDKILPVEVTPFPDVLRRTAIVILVDADPALLKRINQLIAKLGTSDWEQREEAQKKLEEYGKAAQAELQKATKNKDLEIVYRAEQILSKIK
ncbi:MAG: hypothetical protein K0U86_10680 [Planctomycetes bacterium]|nr:hypothetical protein [Planctomycetota bacterium]MCH9725356.1 hypothetical protein [Planctomycetota bacterium]MCH9776136.1 hypothetical protein [Planctomycetota bacterium]